MNGLLSLRLEDGRFLIIVDVVAGLVVVALLLLLLRAGNRRRTAVTVGGAAAGSLVGWGAAWLLGDVFDPFGVPLSTPVRLWSAALFAGVALAITGFVFLRGRRLVVPALALPLCLVAAAAGINADVGQYPTLRAALGIPIYGTLASGSATADTSHGVVGTVTIPATASHFRARPAMVYLPPVLSTPNPPAVPVIEALSGQPGSPQDLFTAGHLATFLDAWAAKHQGVAPIVVVPDQLGSPGSNPMCVDSALGNSATYLTVDVPAWIRSHYSVRPGPSGWAIAGFSQGGTCSIQLAASHPELYGTVLDISGEVRPGSSSPAHATRTGFAGSAAAYAAAAPAALLAAHAPFTGFTVYFVAGSDDVKYLGWARGLADAATRAGASARLIVSPATGHDWHTVRYAMSQVLPLVLHDLEAR